MFSFGTLYNGMNNLLTTSKLKFLKCFLLIVTIPFFSFCQTNESQRNEKEILIKEFILQSKKENDLVKLVDGYYEIATIKNQPHRLEYLDSIIKISKYFKNSEYPAKAYIKKAQHLGVRSRYSEALKNLVLANEYTNNNQKQKLQIEYMIGLLKIQLGEYHEGIEIFEKIDSYYDNIEENTSYSSFDRINNLFGMAYAYNLIKEHNSAHQINKKAINLILKYKDSILYQELLVSSAMTHYYRKEFKPSLDSIYKHKKITSPNKEKNTMKIVSEIFLGHIKYDLFKIEEAERHYKKADSMIFLHKYFHPEIRETYENLLKIHTKEENLNDYLTYLNKLITVDSILNNDYKNISSTLSKKYTTPKLLNEKQEIIAQIEKKYQKTKYIILIITSSLILSLFYWYRNYRRKTIYKQRFDNLIKEKNQGLPSASIKKVVHLSGQIEVELLQSLELFEKNQEYISRNLSIISLSKQLKTNSKYLSLVINKHKENSFQNYINKLRIDYAISRLKSDQKFSNYTIAAIAGECGFNNSQSFSSSFKKITGINPSYFLKLLRENKK